MTGIAQDGPRLFDIPAFEGLGPSRFHPNGDHLGGGVIRSRQLGKEVREKAPKTPGIYAMLDPRNRIIYVGKAKCLRTRLNCYFQKKRERKAAKIIRQTRTLIWEHCADELSALLRELELIQRHRPRFNVLGLPGLRRYCYIAVGRPEAPYLYVTREPSRKDQAVYGPFLGRQYAENAVRRLNDFLGLRDCSANLPMQFAGEQALFEAPAKAGCLRFELGTCAGPCNGGCTRADYHRRVKKAIQFLDGKSGIVLDLLTKRMEKASVELNFERAAAIRDQIHDLDWLKLRLALLRRSRHESAFVYPIVAGGGRGLWFLLNRGRVWGSIWEPQTDEEKCRAAESIDLMNAESPSHRIAVTAVDSVLLLLAWFRKHAGEKQKLRPAGEVLRELRSTLAAAA